MYDCTNAARITPEARLYGTVSADYGGATSP